MKFGNKYRLIGLGLMVIHFHSASVQSAPWERDFRSEWSDFIDQLHEYRTDMNLRLDAYISGARMESKFQLESLIRDLDSSLKFERHQLTQRTSRLAKALTVSKDQSDREFQILRIQFQDSIETGRAWDKVAARGEKLIVQNASSLHRDILLFMTAYAHVMLDDPGRAQHHLAQMVSTFPHSKLFLEAHLLMGEALMKQRRFDEAAASFAIAGFSDNLNDRRRGLLGLSLSQFQNKQTRQALLHLFNLEKHIPDGKGLAPIIRLAAHFIHQSGGIHFSGFPSSLSDFEFPVFLEVSKLHFEQKQNSLGRATVYHLMRKYPKHELGLDAFSMALESLRTEKVVSEFQTRLAEFIQHFAINSPWFLAQSEKPYRQAQSIARLQKYHYEYIALRFQEAQRLKQLSRYAAVAEDYREFIRVHQDAENMDRVLIDYISILEALQKPEWALHEVKVFLQHVRPSKLAPSAFERLVSLSETSWPNRILNTDDVQTRDRNFSSSELTSGEKELIELLEENEDQVDLRSAWGSIRLIQGAWLIQGQEFERSRSKLDSVFRTESTDREKMIATQLIARSYAAEKNWPKAEQWSRNYLRTFKQLRSPASINGVSSVEDLLGESVYRQGEEALIAKQWDQAQTKFLVFAEENPRSRFAPMALAGAAEAAINLGRTRIALKALNRLTRDYPTSEAAPRGLAIKTQLFASIFDVSNAQLSLEQLIRRYPKSELAREAVPQLTRIYEMQSQWEKLGYLLRSEGNLRTGNGKTKLHFEAAEAFTKAGRVREAAQDEEVVLKLDSGDDSLRLRYLSRRYEALWKRQPQAAQGIAKKIRNLAKNVRVTELDSTTRTYLALLYFNDFQSRLDAYGVSLQTKGFKEGDSVAVSKMITTLGNQARRIAAMEGGVHSVRALEAMGLFLQRISKLDATKPNIEFDNQSQDYFLSAWDLARQFSLPNAETNRLFRHVHQQRLDLVFQPHWNEPIGPEVIPTLTQGRDFPESAKEFIHRKQWIAFQTFLSNQAASEPQWGGWKSWYAWSSLRRGEIAKAHWYIETAMKSEGDISMAHYTKSLLLSHRSESPPNDELAYLEVQKALQISPNHPAYLHQKVRTLLQLGRSPEARSVAQIAPKGEMSELFSAWSNGLIDQADGLWKRAIDQFRLILEHDQNHLPAHVAIATIYARELKQPRDALPFVERALLLEQRETERDELVRWAEALRQTQSKGDQYDRRMFAWPLFDSDSAQLP